jgi:hypothetical protein
MPFGRTKKAKKDEPPSDRTKKANKKKAAKKGKKSPEEGDGPGTPTSVLDIPETMGEEAAALLEEAMESFRQPSNGATDGVTDPTAAPPQPQAKAAPKPGAMFFDIPGRSNRPHGHCDACSFFYFADVPSMSCCPRCTLPLASTPAPAAKAVPVAPAAPAASGQSASQIKVVLNLNCGVQVTLATAYNADGSYA